MTTTLSALRLNLHPGQVRVREALHRCFATGKPRFIAMLGGPQSGKTSMAPHLLHEMIDRYRGGDYLAVEATYDLFKLKMLPELLEVFVRTLGIGRYWAEDRVIELAKDLTPGKFLARRGTDPMWGRIILRSADSESGLESATCKGAWLDEFGLRNYTREAWQAVQRRLSLSMGPCLITTTIYTAGWKDIELQALVKAGDGEIISVASTDNPAFPREEYERQRKVMPGWKFNMLYRGIISKPAGLVYSCFDKDGDIVERLPEGWKQWPVLVGHDFGTANPAAVFYVQDKNGALWLFSEYLPGPGCSTADNVAAWKGLTKGMNVVERRGGSHQEEEIREAYRAHGWPISEPTPTGRDVAAGIAHAYSLHAEHKVKVLHDCSNYLDEIMAYAYKLDDESNPSEEIEDKAKFHLMDAERYIMACIRADTVKSGSYSSVATIIRR